ncbi:MAG TPA: hypothetical protein VGD74_09230 [Vulgatibacter sp.]
MKPSGPASLVGPHASSAPAEATPAVDAGDQALALVLRAGLFLAAGLLGAALAASLLFRVPLVDGGGLLSLPTSGGMAAAVGLSARLGIVLLGLTPVARVALSVPIFARSGERSQALVGLGVLVLLLLSMFLGAVEAG